MRPPPKDKGHMTLILNDKIVRSSNRAGTVGNAEFTLRQNGVRYVFTNGRISKSPLAEAGNIRVASEG